MCFFFVGWFGCVLLVVLVVDWFGFDGCICWLGLIVVGFWLGLMIVFVGLLLVFLGCEFFGWLLAWLRIVSWLVCSAVVECRETS